MNNRAREFFGIDETTNISTTDCTDYTDEAGAWYTIDGRKLQGKPNTKGLYIVNGKKTVMRMVELRQSTMILAGSAEANGMNNSLQAEEVDDAW